jgi:integrase
MAPKLRAPKIETRTTRLALPRRRAPYGLVNIGRGIRLGYRRCKHAGTWVLEAADGRGNEWQSRVGTADDLEDADGEFVLSFWQAADKARAMARGTEDNGRPVTVAEALDAYALDLKVRGGLPANAERVRYHLPPALAAKTVSLLTPRELRRLRDGLATKMKAASVNRFMKALKAALNLASKHDQRITNASAWRVGLEALPDAHQARNTVLNDDEVRALIAAAYDVSAALGLLVEAAAVTGARPSQLARLEIADLQDDRPDPRVMMPSSRKGRGHKRISRAPVAITPTLAAKLRQAAGDRALSAPLLLKSDGAPWRPDSHGQPFAEAVARAGLDPAVTLYALRHSSIVRQLLGNVPVRVVASTHDTSIPMIEKSYSAFINDHADALTRRVLLDSARPASANIVSLPRGRR